MIGKVKVTSTEPAKHDPTLGPDAKVEATKENCFKAVALLQHPKNTGMDPDAFNFLSSFLDSCTPRLPTQAAVDRDKARKKGKKV